MALAYLRNLTTFFVHHSQLRQKRRGIRSPFPYPILQKTSSFTDESTTQDSPNRTEKASLVTGLVFLLLAWPSKEEFPRLKHLL